MMTRKAARLSDSFGLPTGENGTSGTCGMAVPGAWVHPLANALIGKKLAHNMMRRRPKNIFPCIY